MFKIWAKIIDKEKIVRQVTYENDGPFVNSQFFSYVAEICDGLDIATPIVLKTHLFNFVKFRTVRFLPRDFTETPEFDKLVLDNITI